MQEMITTQYIISVLTLLQCFAHICKISEEQSVRAYKYTIYIYAVATYFYNNCGANDLALG